MNVLPITRRRFLGTAAAATAGLFTSRLRGAEPFRLSFFVCGDTHYLANAEKVSELDALSAETNAGLIRTLNELRGATIPATARAGNVGEPRGVIHVGDLIDSGNNDDEPHAAMQETEVRAWLAAYGLNGEGGALRYPVYEVHGNHDAPKGQGIVLPHLVERNRRRADVRSISPNGLHYSWDWGPVHFVCLGLIVGTEKSVTRQRHFAALDSLDFLRSNLAENVGDSGRPVVLVHHLDVARYSLPLDGPGPFENKEWDPADVHAYYETIRNYRVAAIFYGHTHTRNVFRWDGSPTKAPEGIPIFNCDNSGHFRFDEQAFFHVEMNERELVVREQKTEDRWRTATWTPTAWTVPLV
jgi:cytolysin (calcineurin-like family phosphatase)